MRETLNVICTSLEKGEKETEKERNKLPSLKLAIYKTCRKEIKARAKLDESAEVTVWKMGRDGGRERELGCMGFQV